MSANIRIWCACCAIFASAAAPALAGDAFRMFFVPAGDDPLDYSSGPTVVHAVAGSTLRMEVFLENIPEPVRGVASTHECVAPGGLAGSVSYEDGSAAINMLRPDFIFFQIPAQGGVDACNYGDQLRLSMGLNAGDLVVTEPKYIYEFALEVSPDAVGTFAINFSGGSGAANVDSQSIGGLTFEPLFLLVNCDSDKADCNDNGVLDACDIAEGFSKDCNVNGVPDACDLSEGTSGDCNENGVPDDCDADCDGNGVPDECEPDCDDDGVPDACERDCNTNGRSDDCEIADGDSEDCTDNGFPDECETDCNQNGIADSCDVANGTSPDLDDNGIPDECAFRVFFVPAGDDPRDYPAGPTVVNAPGLQGRTISFEVFVVSAPEPVRRVQIQIPCTADASAAVSGSVEYVPGTAEVDTDRGDSVVANCGTADSSIFQACNPDIFLIASLSVGDCSNAMLMPSYVGQVDLAVSTDAEGTFTLEIVAANTRIVRENLQLIPGLVTEPLIISLGCPPSSCADVSDCTCDVLDGCTLARCIDGDCVYSAKLAADVDRNAAVDIFDILCVLDAFSGKFDRCTFEDTDVAGCQADGKIDILDIFAVLDGFEGTDACLSTCGHPVCVGSCTHP